jgi:hypothetical protein
MTGTAEASNPQVRNPIRPTPQIARSAPRTLSRWRHGFEPVGTTSANPQVKGGCTWTLRTVDTARRGADPRAGRMHSRTTRSLEDAARPLRAVPARSTGGLPVACVATNSSSRPSGRTVRVHALSTACIIDCDRAECSDVASINAVPPEVALFDALVEADDDRFRVVARSGEPTVSFVRFVSPPIAEACFRLLPSFSTTACRSRRIGHAECSESDAARSTTPDPYAPLSCRA